MLKIWRGNVIVWAYITLYGPRVIVKIEGTMTAQSFIDILDTNVNFAQHSYFWQSDNEPKLKTPSVIHYLQSRGIIRLPWPSNSPGLNIIEHV